MRAKVQLSAAEKTRWQLAIIPFTQFVHSIVVSC